MLTTEKKRTFKMFVAWLVVLSLILLVPELAAMAGFDASATTITVAGARAGAFRITATISVKIIASTSILIISSLLHFSQALTVRVHIQPYLIHD